ncbi:hypothetical protein V9T40_007692 [Parthenolecanium corni]|uniref:U1-type domain-containing protein n=1 Tax=Parthenolecanium corni TaxID=536013 RepID=A0AAN9TVS0_9HEMI
MMIDSFFDFLSKLDAADRPIVDCHFMTKLHDIDRILSNLLKKNHSSAFNTHRAEEKTKRKESIPSKIEIKKGKMSFGDDEKRNSIDAGRPIRSESDDTFSRMEKYMSRDLDGSDNSDCEMKSETVASKDLFQTDYPDECFNEKKKQKDVSNEDVTSSNSKPAITAIEDDTYIKKLNSEKANVESNTDPNRDNYPFIVKVIEDVYTCQLCSINNLPKNNLITHVNGRQHKNALIRLNESEAKSGSKVRDTSLPTVLLYECTLCKTEINSRDFREITAYSNEIERITELLCHFYTKK